MVLFMRRNPDAKLQHKSKRVTEGISSVTLLNFLFAVFPKNGKSAYLEVQK